MRKVSRPRWLSGRAGLILTVLVTAGAAGGVSFWAAAGSQHGGLGFSQLLLAGLNSAARRPSCSASGCSRSGSCPG